MSDPAPTPEPPLVLRAEPQAAPPSAPPVPRKPAPGFWGAVLWCLLFIAVQLSCAIGVILLVLGLFAVRSDDPGKFLDAQLGGFAASAKQAGPNDPPRPQMPIAIGQALASGMLAAQVGSLLLIVLVVPRVVGPDWKRQFGVRTPAGLHVFLVLLIVPGFMLLSDGIQELFLRITGITRPAANEAIHGTFNTVPLFITLVAVGLGPGLVEELWCRGFLGRGLSARYGLGWGVLCTSVMFGMLHMDPSLVFITGLMGAYLHFLYLATRSIWVPVLLHMLNNGLTALILLSPTLVEAAKEYGADQHGFRAVTELAALGLIVFGSVALWTSRARLFVPSQTDVGPEEKPWKEEYPGVSAPPPGSPVKLGHAAVSSAAMLLTLASFGVLVFLLSKLDS
ncbi:MAG: CPBP family intramembrane glutamic endopeptidase [Gemmataceae bacterium]